MATLYIRLIRQETAAAYQVILSCRRRFWWLPKAAILSGESFRAGQEDVEMIVPDGLVAQKEREWRQGPKH